MLLNRLLFCVKPSKNNTTFLPFSSCYLSVTVSCGELSKRRMRFHFLVFEFDLFDVSTLGC